MNTFIEIPANKLSLSMRKPACGVGINDTNYLTYTKIDGRSARCPFYMKWLGMIKRCYSIKCQEKHPAYIGCSVSEEWRLFSNFKRWMKKQDWEGKQLDKDIIRAGNKIYSAETCIFVSSKINTLLNKQAPYKGEYPTGVCLCKRDFNFIAFCRIDGGRSFLGRYDTPEEASRIYREFKSAYVRKIAKEYIDDTRLYNGLMNHAELILKQA